MLKHAATGLVTHGVQILAILNSVDLLDQIFEHVAHINISESTRFHEEKFVLSCIISSEFSCNLALTRMLLCKI